VRRELTGQTEYWGFSLQITSSRSPRNRKDGAQPKLTRLSSFAVPTTSSRSAESRTYTSCKRGHFVSHEPGRTISFAGHLLPVRASSAEVIPSALMRSRRIQMSFLPGRCSLSTRNRCRNQSTVEYEQRPSSMILAPSNLEFDPIAWTNWQTL
jgi:hypothetical protein